MAGIITEKTKRGKEAFDLYIKNEGDQSTFTYLTKKYGLSVSTIRGDIYHYMNRVVSPKPTNDELKLYKKIVKFRQYNLGKKNATFLYEKAAQNRDIKYNDELIEELLSILYFNELNTYLINSKYSTNDIFKEVEAAIKIKDSETELDKLNKIQSFIENNRKDLNDKRRLNTRHKTINSNKEKNIKEIANILEEMLIEGFDKLNSIIIKSNINRYTFDNFLPLLASGNKLEQTLYTQYNNELANDEILLEDNYIKMIYFLENGIEKNGIKTYFNILDYFRMTKVNPDIFLRRGNKLIKENRIKRIQYNLVRSFFELYDTSFRILSQNEARNYYYSISGTVIGTEDKEKIINYLENELGLKLYTGVFIAACEEVLKGTLSFKKIALE